MMLWKLIFRCSLLALITAGFWSEPMPFIYPPLDKVAHLLGFTFLSLCMFYTMRVWPIWFSTLLLLLLGLLIELGQEWFLPLRTFSAKDLIANALGVLIAILIYSLYRYIKR